MTWEDILKGDFGDEWEEGHARKIHREYLDIYKRIDLVAFVIGNMKHSDLGEPVNYSAYLPRMGWEEKEVEFFEKLHKKLEKLANSKRAMVSRMHRLFKHDSGKKKISKEEYNKMADFLEDAPNDQKRIIDFEKLTQALGE
tara:strand:- start:79 stop:501 length:423 start_codon:yes stop_codon:yes gene_type:complete